MSNRAYTVSDEAVFNPAWIGYIVRLTNSFPQPLPVVHVQSNWGSGQSSLLAYGPMQPGEVDAIPVGTVADLVSYAVAAYDREGRAILTLPAAGVPITPLEAASALPFRPNSHTDDWTLEPSLMLDMTAPYTVTIVNKTTDTWDEVTLFYRSADGTTPGLESTAVGPDGSVTFELGPAGAMLGYAWTVWVDGLRAYLAEGQLQYPADGFMTARRAAETKGHLSRNADTWTVGED